MISAASATWITDPDSIRRIVSRATERLRFGHRVILESHGPGRVLCRRLIGRMQCFQEGHQCRRLWRAQILTISRHIASTLDDLSNQLIMGEAQGHGVESRAALPSLAI